MKLDRELFVVFWKDRDSEKLMMSGPKTEAGIEMVQSLILSREDKLLATCTVGALMEKLGITDEPEAR